MTSSSFVQAGFNTFVVRSLLPRENESHYYFRPPLSKNGLKHHFRLRRGNIMVIKSTESSTLLSKVNKLRCPNFAYWLGVMQTDGNFRTYPVKEKKRRIPYLKSECRVIVSHRSLPMISKFHKLSNELFDKHVFLTKNKRGQHVCRVYVRKLLRIFEGLNIRFNDPPVPPAWIKNSNMNFGAYIAGVIDGDGYVKLKRNRDRRVPQCVVTISSGKPQYELAKSIQDNLNCKPQIVERTNIGRKGTWFELTFYISRKTNLRRIEKSVLPSIMIPHKRIRIRQKILLEGSWSSLDKTRPCGRW